MTSFRIAWHHATPHGVVAAVHIPDSPDPVPEPALAQLRPAESEYARGLRGYQQGQFVGGRLAIRAACGQIGVRPPPVLPDEYGAPRLPRGLVGSISHKRTLAVAMVARDLCGTLGVDLEDYGPPRPTVLGRVLTDEELAAVEELVEDRRWISALVRFSIKESVYKAIHPLVHRYVGFHEAVVTPDLQGGATVELRLDGGEGPFQTEAHYEWLYGRLLTSVRIRQVSCTPRANGATIGPSNDEDAT